MFNHVKTTLFVVGISLFLMSCMGKPSYTYSGITYESPELAFAAQKNEFNTIVSKITPTNNPTGASAVVILPSRLYWERNFPVTWKGVEPSQEGKEIANSYLSTMAINNWRLRGEALEKRRIFGRVVIINSDDPANAPFAEDIALLLTKKDGNEQWFMKSKMDKIGNMKEIDEISPALPPVQRMMLWLDNVEKLARQE